MYDIEAVTLVAHNYVRSNDHARCCAVGTKAPVTPCHIVLLLDLEVFVSSTTIGSSGATPRTE